VTKRGDLYDLIDRAPVDLNSFSASLWKWSHRERSARARELLARGRGGVTHFVLASASPITETDDEHLTIWLVPPDKWHIASDTRIDLRNGPMRWYGPSDHITELEGTDTGLGQTDLGILIEPGSHLLGAVRFGDPVEDEIDGRRCWRTDASTAEATHQNRHPLMTLGMRLGGIDHQFWFDAATGIILRHVGLIEGQPCTIAEFTNVTINEPIPDEIFQFVPPEGAIVERRIDQIVRMAEQRGVDLSDVDRTDPKAVQEAMSARTLSGTTSPRLRKSRQAEHIPVGPPPADETAARSAIEYAYSHHDETDDDGEILVNIQGCPAWTDLMERARHRIPGSPEGDLQIVVDDIKFLRDDEAVVWFSVEIDGSRLSFVNGREGRAVLVNGRWMVEHAGLADLLGMAGVEVPPPGP
jgi:hypothetical protein